MVAVRVDAFAETDRYTNGCHINPVPYGCLSCPLAVCILDDPWQAQRARRDQRREKVRELVVKGIWQVDEIAKHLQISTRTAYRDLQEIGHR